MHFSVLHKGIVLVAVPLALQVAFVGLLGNLLSKCDRAQAREAERSRFSMIGARLIFANCTAGSILLNAWNNGDMSILDQFPEQCEYIDKLHQQMGCPADDVIEGREVHAKAMQAQELVSHRLKQIEEVAHEGIGMGSYRKVLALHRRLVKELDMLFGLMRIRYAHLDETAAQHRAEIKQMQTEELSLLIGGFIASAAVAFLLAQFYNKQIVQRIEKTKAGVASITFGKTLHGELGGKDEIAALYASFQNMSTSGRCLKIAAT
jgi:methyl-accepting chemotaxis protein